MATTMATVMMATVTAAMTMMMTSNEDEDDSGGGWRAPAAADGMVWGRHQAAGGREHGNKAEMGTMWV
jgi:hypothetical protein